jgi:hypothetical protein
MDVETAPHFPDRLRLKLAFDPDWLAADLDRLREVVWTGHFVRQNYHGEWSAIALRAPANATHPVMMIYSDPAATDFADTALLARTPYFRKVLAAFQCPLQAVRLMRLAPGSIIKRLHVPVTTNPQVEFRLNRSRVVMEAGSTWYLRLSDPHSVTNRGETDRVHLVIDAAANGWLAAQFDAAA